MHGRIWTKVIPDGVPVLGWNSQPSFGEDVEEASLLLCGCFHRNKVNPLTG
jgi:hypothetical protein